MRRVGDKICWFSAAVVLVAMLAPQDAAGRVYYYVDSNGTIHYTNAPTSRKYRPLKRFDRFESRRRGAAVKRSYRGSRRPKRFKGPSYKRKEDRYRYDHYIREASRRYNIPFALIKGVIAAESDFDHEAVSYAGAEGLMQLVPSTARMMNVNDTFDPYENIMGGTKYLRYLANMFNGDLVLMLAAYNAGHNLVKELNRVPNIPGIRNYIRKVIRYYRQYQQEEREARERKRRGGRRSGGANNAGGCKRLSRK